MMKRLKALLMWFGLVVGMSESYGRMPDYCFNLYKQGGVRAVLQSSECSFAYLHLANRNQTTKCQLATLQGRREYQEDRVFCDLDMQTDLLSKSDQGDLPVGLAAVFDGHGGKEASQLAVQLLPYYLQLHVSFLTQMKLELQEGKHERAFPLETEVNPLGNQFRREIHESEKMEVLEEAIVLTIHDIDSTFSQMALTKHLLAGTTATIALIIDGQLLVANVGDSKALLCSEKIRPSNEVNGISPKSLQVTELTEDHHPDRENERARIEAAGGFVSMSGVPRVNGILAVSRSIGDIYLKRYGVTAEPEVTGWHHLNPRDMFLVVASDGIFESLSLQEVCNLVQEAHVGVGNETHQRSSECLSSLLAECIVKMAFEKGSTDNLSAVVVPLSKHFGLVKA